MARHAVLHLSNGRKKKIHLAHNVSIVSFQIFTGKIRAGRTRVEFTDSQLQKITKLRNGDHIEVKDWYYPTLYTKLREISTSLGRGFKIKFKDVYTARITRKY